MSPTKSTNTQSSDTLQQTSNPVAIFVGGTSGIGEATCIEFVQNTSSPKIYIVGRDRSRGSKLVAQLSSLNPNTVAIFLPADLTLLSNVDSVCRQILEKEDRINLLFMTANFLSLDGRDETTEGLDKMYNLQYYTRMRFIDRLLPSLTKASRTNELSSVISVLGAGREGQIFQNDLLLKEHYNLKNCARQAICMTSLAFDKLAVDNPGVSFIHTSPGVVRGTNIMTGMGPIISTVARFLFVFMAPFTVSLQQCARIHLSIVRDSRVLTKKSQSGECAKGVMARIGQDGKPVDETGFLRTYRGEGLAEVIWNHTMKVFDGVCGK